MDALDKLANEQLWFLSKDIEIQLEKGTGTRPVVYMLAMQRRRAVLAFDGLVNADAEDAKTIRGFQQELKLYHDMVDHCRELLARGKEADRQIEEEERFALAEAVDQMSDDERKALNIEPRGDD